MQLGGKQFITCQLTNYHNTTNHNRYLPCVIYWPLTEPSIKRCTCVYKWRNSGSRWAWSNYIIRCHRWLGAVPVGVGDKMPNWESAADRGLGPWVTHGWAAQPGCERSAVMVRRTLGQNNSPSLSPLSSHTQPTSTLLRIKCEKYIFIKKCVRSFIEVVIIVDYVSTYNCIYICLWLWVYNILIELLQTHDICGAN